jgi:hypothetical protein
MCKISIEEAKKQLVRKIKKAKLFPISVGKFKYELIINPDKSNLN